MGGRIRLLSFVTGLYRVPQAGPQAQHQRYEGGDEAEGPLYGVRGGRRAEGGEEQRRHEGARLVRVRARVKAGWGWGVRWGWGEG
mgnify:CR=1 FL=1